MVGIALLVVGLAFATPAAPAPPGSKLTITYWAGGKGTVPVLRRELRCDPSGGSLPGAASACARLAGMRDPFAVPSSDQVCTEIYGGPQEAIVAGRWDDRRIWIRLGRSNGCEIARFQRLRFLVPSFSERTP